jgi:hypothetical protein
MKKFIILSIFVLLFLVGCISKPQGVAKDEDFKKPDIKDDFCGIYINFQYCKCAFHGDFCKEIGMSKKEAKKYVQNEYDKWLETKRLEFNTNCQNANGYFIDDTCNYCEEGYIAQKDLCIISNEADLDKKDNVKLPEGPYNKDCSLKQDEFDRDWKKFSDIDEAIAPEERSYEAKEALTAYETMIGKLTESFEISRDIEIEEETQAVLNEYRQALVMNQKTNLLKAFWRLSWVTYSTIKSGVSTGKSFSNIITSSGSAAQNIASGLKTFQAVIPSNSDLAIDKSKISGKAMIIGAKTALEGVESLGDPGKVAARFMKSSFDAAMPSANITEAEFNIIKQQQIDKGLVDQVLAESRAENAARQAKLNTIEQEIKVLELKISEWENKEKGRVANSLIDSCKTLINQAPATSE